MTNKIIPFSFDEVRFGDILYNPQKNITYKVHDFYSDSQLVIKQEDGYLVNKYIDDGFFIDRRNWFVRLFYPFKIPKS